MKKQILLNLPLICVILTFIGCFPPPIPIYQANLDSSEDERLEPLELTPSFDLYRLRNDLIRQTTSDCDGDESDVPYESSGFKLGNGLFYDLEGNLSLNIPHLFGLEDFENFDLHELKSDLHFSKNEKGYSKEYDRRFRKKKGYFFKELIKTPDGTIIRPNNRRLLGFKFKDTVIEPKENGFNVTSSFEKYNFETNDKGVLVNKRQYFAGKDSIRLGGNFIVKNVADKIEIRNFHKKQKKQYLLYTLHKKGNEVFILDPYFRGFKIVKEEDKIIIEENKVHVATYQLIQNS